ETVRSSRVTIRDSLSTWVRAVNQITPYRGAGDAWLSTATAERPSRRPCAHRSYWGWKIENVLSPLTSSRGHASSVGSVAIGPISGGIGGDAVVHAARLGAARSAPRRTARSGLIVVSPISPRAPGSRTRTTLRQPATGD